ncbi:FRG domain-containing protein [Pelomonas sp. Root1237]|uniref:FRG domain-containing protein n=1 Tax=Pelomonas sp. Root1237 TaxID=1736434 RepID=UPI0009E74389|nr:FRG domain-containing protein [Pelomonas sp. Root1237]
MFEFLQDQNLKENIHSAKSRDDWEQVFRHLEMFGPFTAAAAECPFSVVTPPILEPKEEWCFTRDPAIDEATWKRLTNSSFMPLDRALLERRALTDLVKISETPATHPLIDLDYGLVLTPGGRMRNFTLDYAHLLRVQRLDKHYVQYPSAIFSVGALRARGVLNLPSEQSWMVPEFEIHDRAGIDQILGKLRERLGKNAKAELWFRGQTSDILLDGALGSEQLCPWRNTRDSSLVPSLYRGAWHGGDLKAYAEKLVRIQKYVGFAGRHLRIQPFTVRAPSELSKEKLPEEWNSYAISFSSHQTDASGKHLSSRDYHHAFDGLQRSFFLQHYGLPSNILDITKDVDTALFFAQNRIDENKRVVEAPEGAAVLYVFILLPGIDRFLDSETLSERFGLLRPARQKCGLLCGASFINRNHYARYISLKFRLRRKVEYHSKLTAEYIYPPREEDSFLDALLRFAESEGPELGNVTPFVPNLGLKVIG